MLERDAMSTARLLGFLVHERSTPNPLLEVRRGMSVLYGLNGAGKSRILTDISRFFDGLVSETLALVRLPSDVEHVDWFRETDVVDWFADWAHRAGMDVGDPEEVLRRWLEACLSADDVTMPGVPHTSAVLRSNRFDALINEWLQHPLILVKAVGSGERRSWASAPAFCTGESTPCANAEVELFEIFEELDPALDGFAQIALIPYGRTVDGRTIACASHAGQPNLDDDAISFSAGIHDQLLKLSPSVVASTDDLDAQTRKHLFDHVAGPVDIVDGQPQSSSTLVDHVDKLQALANEHFAEVLQDAPCLRLHVNPVGLGRQVHWFVADDDEWEDPAEVSQRINVPADQLPEVRTLAGLSTAQQRWARWSIEMALNLMGRSSPEASNLSESRLYLLDEPEAALHRSAEAQMARYFTGLARTPEPHMIVATHSPELLETDSARVYEVSRVKGGWRRLQVLDAASRENMTALGLGASDLLRRQRGFVLVEGRHDELILEELFGEEMRRLRVETLPLRGTSELSPAKISFLFDYTPAHMFLMLDNIQSEELTAVWEQALEHLDRGHPSEAEAVVNNAECLKTGEGKKLAKVLVHALLNELSHRVTPHGLSCADIIEYLPVRALVPVDATWEELRRRHAELRAAGKNLSGDFKKWLAHDYKADFGDDALLAAVEGLDAPPPDLLRMWKTIEAHVSR